MNIKRLYMPLAAIMLLLTISSILPACNSETIRNEDPDYIRGSELTVTKFFLQANPKIMSHLDSVYFAIDLEQGVIYNADSLPMGTPINKLIPMITVPQTVEKVNIIMEETDGTRKIIDYREHPSDTIDFTKQVTLELSTLNESAKRSYLLKVNVHKMNPDSLCFDLDARAALPSRLQNPKRQKTVSRNATVYTLVCEADGSYTLASTEALERGDWEKQSVQMPDAPRIETLTATDDAFFMLDNSGLLYRSDSGVQWEPAGNVRWVSIIGAFDNKLQGVRMDGDKYLHTQYPLQGFAESVIPDNFPYRDASDMSIYSTKWSSQPLGLITGGETLQGVTGHTWAFDGTVWCDITERALPSLKGGTLIPYYAYLRSTTMWIFNEYSIWLYVGGVAADGTLNRTVYMTFDNGVHWQEAPQAMQLPEEINALYHIGHAVIATPLEATFSNSWTATSGRRHGGVQRLPYVINGYNITWNCPYIYLIGGMESADAATVSPWIYRGVINRMSFKPLI